MFVPVSLASCIQLIRALNFRAVICHEGYCWDAGISFLNCETLQGDVTFSGMHTQTLIQLISSVYSSTDIIICFLEPSQVGPSGLPDSELIMKVLIFRHLM